MVFRPVLVLNSKHSQLQPIYIPPAAKPNWIITDVRFPNELEAIKDRNGIIIRVDRYDLIYTTEDKHESEVALDNSYTEFDYTIDNNTGIGNLIDKVKFTLQHAKII